MLLATTGERPGMLLSILQHTDPYSLEQRIIWPQVSIIVPRSEKLWPHQPLLLSLRPCPVVMLSQCCHQLLFIMNVHYSKILYFVYLLKFICNLKINTCDTFGVVAGHAQSSKTNVSHPTWMSPAEVKWGEMLLSCSSSHTCVNKCPVCDPCSATFPHCFVFSVGDSAL